MQVYVFMPRGQIISFHNTARGTKGERPERGSYSVKMATQLPFPPRAHAAMAPLLSPRGCLAVPEPHVLGLLLHVCLRAALSLSRLTLRAARVLCPQWLLGGICVWRGHSSITCQWTVWGVGTRQVSAAVKQLLGTVSWRLFLNMCSHRLWDGNGSEGGRCMCTF